MDQLASEALDHIKVVISGYLPSVGIPDVARELYTLPLEIKPTGLSGYVGQHPDPVGAVHGRYVIAQTEIVVTATNIGDVNTTITAATEALLLQDRETLREAGIFSIKLKNVSEISFNNQFAKTARFEIAFEYLKIPAAAGDIIEEIPIGLSVI